MQVLSTPPSAGCEFADAAQSLVAAAMRSGWLVLRGGMVSSGDGSRPITVQYALIHARKGIALVDVVPGTTTPTAADMLRERLDGVGFADIFGRNPPILYFCVSLSGVPDMGLLLEQKFGRQPSSALPSGNAWITMVQDALSAKLLEGPGPQARVSGTSGKRFRRHTRGVTSVAKGRCSVRRLGGARLLAGFWSMVSVSLGGGVLFLQYLGPPPERVYSESVIEKRHAVSTHTYPVPSLLPNQADEAPPVLVSLVNAKAIRGVADAGGEAPLLIADTSDPIETEGQLGLIENDRAIIDLQKSLETYELPAGTIPGTSPPDTSSAAPEVLQGNSSTATAVERQHDSDGSISTTPAETVATPPSAGMVDLQTPLTPQSSEGPTAEDALPETLVHSDAQGQAVRHSDEETAPPASKDDAVSNQNPPSSTSAEAPAEASTTVRPHEPDAVVAPNVANAGPSSAQRSISPVMAAVMLRRAEAFLRTGDVSAARLLYQALAVAGSGRAATAMGKTFDAAFLLSLGVTGIVADPVLATSWYRRGLDLGDEQARLLLQALPAPAGTTTTAQEKPP